MKTEKDPQLEAELERLIEDLAEAEHDQWISWSKYVASHNKDLPKPLLDRWRSLWIAYEHLSEEEKEKDRIWARKVCSIFEAHELAYKLFKKPTASDKVKPDET